MAYFPVFINIENFKVVIVGAGKIAARRINILKNFGADITVITKEVKSEISNVNIIIKEFSKEDIKNCDMVIAATDNQEVNKNVIETAKNAGIKYYNNAADKSDNNFYFPAVIENNDIICALISKEGINHKNAKDYAEKLRKIL